MIELTPKQAEYIEYMRLAIFDPEIKALVENQDIINQALLIGYVVTEK